MSVFLFIVFRKCSTQSCIWAEFFRKTEKPSQSSKHKLYKIFKEQKTSPSLGLVFGIGRGVYR
ncbi:MAG: hypothetical protein COV70_03525 [Parcubacteria group bacterium CG11_big_fil_rev_8_21_14_0_20_39_22]|nr:MAG: hypothetical protein COV70_03525 [Parcubacteria group bacterium CG11_big_fil_rev_8_21_14_0_20_39_22]